MTTIDSLNEIDPDLVNSLNINFIDRPVIINSPVIKVNVIATQLELNEYVKNIAQKTYKALPPWAEEARVHKAIYSDEQIKKTLGEEEIISIKKDMERNIYIVQSEHNRVEVKVNYGRSHLIGPSPFTLEILSHQES